MPDAATTRSEPGDELTLLMQRVARGDRAAFEAMYRHTSAKLFGIVLRILKRRELAEEVLQETYVKIWNEARRFDPARASAVTWMVAIARNRALDELRRRQPALLDDTRGVNEPVDPLASPQRRAESNAALARLLACLDQLKADRRAAVSLAYFDGLSRAELADRLGQPVGTIKTWLHRSVKQLKECLGT